MAVETDKAIQEIEAHESGYLSQVAYKDGDEIPVGQVMALLTAEPEAGGGAAAEKTAPAEEKVPEKVPEKAPKKAAPTAVATAAVATKSSVAAPQPVAPKAVAVDSNATVLASAKARAAAKEQGLSLAQVAATLSGRQPLHSKDIAEYQNIVANQVPVAASYQGMQAQAAQNSISIKFASEGLSYCQQWFADSGKAESEDKAVLNGAHLIAFLAADLWREQLLPYSEQELGVLVGYWADRTFTQDLLIDPDNQRFSNLAVTEESVVVPQLQIVDLRQTRLSDFTLGAQSQPMLLLSETKGKSKGKTKITLQGFTADLLPQSVQFLELLVDRLQQPLLYLA